MSLINFCFYCCFGGFYEDIFDDFTSLKLKEYFIPLSHPIENDYASDETKIRFQKDVKVIHLNDKDDRKPAWTGKNDLEKLESLSDLLSIKDLDPKRRQSAIRKSERIFTRLSTQERALHTTQEFARKLV